MAELTNADWELVEQARRVIQNRFRPDWHVVGAALRTRSGRIVTGVHLEAYVGRVAVCAEAIALGRAVTEHGESEIDTIVAVRHPEPGDREEIAKVVSPCGMCREMLNDYSPFGFVIVPQGKGLVKMPIRDLLPSRYTRG